MKRKHAHGPQSVYNKRDNVITARLMPIDPTIKPLCEVNYTIPKAWLDALKLKESDRKEPLVNEQLNNRCNTTESVSSESAGLQTIIDDLRDELSETRTALDAVTLDRNQYKRVKELAECKLWDEQDQKNDMQAQLKELTAINQELTQKVQHLTIQNENLNKLLNHNSDNTAEELQLPKAEVRYIVFERTNLSKCIKATCLDTVIYYVKCGNTYAYTYDRVKSQLEKADVAMFHDHFIVKL